MGLDLTTASRAAFLVQGTAILTPLLETAAGGRLSRPVWGSCALALAGSVVISSSSVEAAVAPGAQGLAMLGLHLFLLYIPRCTEEESVTAGHYPIGPGNPGSTRMTLAD